MESGITPKAVSLAVVAALASGSCDQASTPEAREQPFSTEMVGMSKQERSFSDALREIIGQGNGERKFGNIRKDLEDLSLLAVSNDVDFECRTEFSDENGILLDCRASDLRPLLASSDIFDSIFLETPLVDKRAKVRASEKIGDEQFFIRKLILKRTDESGGWAATLQTNILVGEETLKGLESEISVHDHVFDDRIVDKLASANVTEGGHDFQIYVDGGA